MIHGVGQGERQIERERVVQVYAPTRVTRITHMQTVVIAAIKAIRMECIANEGRETKRSRKKTEK